MSNDKKKIYKNKITLFTSGRNVMKHISFFALCFVLLSTAGCRKDVKDENGNEPPVIEWFLTNPQWGDAPLEVEFNWTISDPDGDSLSCSLDADGDGTFDATFENCSSDDKHTHTFTEPGSSEPRLVVTDGSGNTSELSTQVYANRLVFADNVIFPEKTDGFVSAQVDPGEVILTFESASSVPEIKEGDILWGTSGLGYLKRVLSVSTSESGNEVTVETGDAKVEEAVEHGFFGVRNYFMRINDIQCTQGCENVVEAVVENRLEMNHSTAIFPLGGWFGIRITFSDENIVREGHNLVEISSVTITLGIAINNFVVDIGWSGLEEFTFEISPTAKVSASMGFKMKLAEFERTIAETSFVLAAVPLGPFVVIPKFSPSLKFKANLEPTLTINPSVGVNMDGGFSYQDGETSVYGDLDLEPSMEIFNVKFGVGSTKLEFYPGLDFMLLGVLGPTLGPKAYIKSSLYADLLEPEVCINGKVGADFSFGIALDLFFTRLEASNAVAVAEFQFFEQCFSAAPEEDADAAEDAETEDIVEEDVTETEEDIAAEDDAPDAPPDIDDSVDVSMDDAGPEDAAFDDGSEPEVLFDDIMRIGDIQTVWSGPSSVTIEILDIEISGSSVYIRIDGSEHIMNESTSETSDEGFVVTVGSIWNSGDAWAEITVTHP